MNNGRKLVEALIRENRRLRKEIKQIGTIFLQFELMQKKFNDCARTREEELELFIGSIVHDMRLPVVTMGLAARNLLKKRKKQLTVGEKKEILEVILAQSGNLEVLIGNIMKTIRSRKALLELEGFPVSELFETLKKTFSQKLSEKNIDLQISANSALVVADKSRLIESIGNLIDNALKYGGEGFSEIHLGFHETKNLFVFSVYNNGSSIQEDQLEKIFQPFQQGVHKKIGGYGLGLFSVKSIAERHGGKAWATSTGRGVTFFLSISREIPNN